MHKGIGAIKEKYILRRMTAGSGDKALIKDAQVLFGVYLDAWLGGWSISPLQLRNFQYDRRQRTIMEYQLSETYVCLLFALQMYLLWSFWYTVIERVCECLKALRLHVLLSMGRAAFNFQPQRSCNVACVLQSCKKKRYIERQIEFLVFKLRTPLHLP